MDKHDFGEISFRVFAITMSVLSDKAEFDEKCKLSFEVYDLNDDKVIDKIELKTLIMDLLNTAKGQDFMDPLLVKLINSNDYFVDKLIENTMKCFDLDNNGNITYQSYAKFIKKNPRLLQPFTLDIEKLLDYEAEQRRMKRISLNSLKKKKLRQIVIGQDPKKQWNKKWHKPQWYKDMEKDQIQHVNSIHDANEICKDMFDHDIDTINETIKEEDELFSAQGSGSGSSSDAGSDINDEEAMKKKEEEERRKQEDYQDTLDLLYD